MKKLKWGFTLVELLVFVTILSLFFVTAVSVAVASLRNIKTNEHRLMATRYAEELAEWLRSEREADWVSFITRASPSGTNWCFTTSPISSWPQVTGTCGTDFSIPPFLSNIYKRDLTIRSLNSDTQAIATINVTWQEGNGSVGIGNTMSVPLTVNFAVWEQKP